MSFQQGLSGLNAASKALDVTSNNVANSATVGFKSAQAHFADVFAASLGGGGSTAVGIGTSVAAIQQQFTQGNITTTNNPLDISINGGGFFRMSDSGSISYSRAGQFHLDNTGYIVDDQARRLVGNQYALGEPTGKVGDLSVSNALIAPSVSKEITMGVNLDSSETVKAVPLAAGFLIPVAPATVPPTWQAPDINSYNSTTSQPIYDSLGNPHTATYYYVKSAANTWDVLMTVDQGLNNAGTIYKVTTAAPLVFSTQGALSTPAGGLVTPGPSIAWDPAMGVAAQSVKFDLAESTQFGSAFSVNQLSQDGFTSGRMTAVSIGADGVILGNYSNGQTQEMGQIVLANFVNPNGLASLGGNQWSETSASGPALVGAPNTGTLGVLQSAAVEESNTDLTAELVNMITQQRNYQANAQSIKTQDAIMQTLINLR